MMKGLGYGFSMNMYSMMIGLQEARRWVEAGYPDHAKFQIEMAQQQLEELIKQYTAWEAERTGGTN